MFRLEDALAVFRAMETNEDAIPILGNEDAMRVLSSWTKTDQVWSKPRRKLPELTHANHSRVWQWIVSGWTIDVNEVARGANVSPRVAAQQLEVLTTNRLIYPDGSMSKGARAALNIYVAQKLGIKQKPRQQPTPKAGGNTDKGETN